MDQMRAKRDKSEEVRRSFLADGVKRKLRERKKRAKRESGKKTGGGNGRRLAIFYFFRLAALDRTAKKE